MTKPKSEKITKLSSKKVISVPIIPLRDVVLLPGNRHELFIGRPKSLEALIFASKSASKHVVFVTQRDEQENQPNLSDLYDWGCLAKVDTVVDAEEDVKRVAVQAIDRVKIEQVYLDAHAKMQQCDFTLHKSNDEPNLDEGKKILKQLIAPLPTELLQKVKKARSLSVITDIITEFLNMSIDERQQLLETTSVRQRIVILCEYFAREVKVSNIEKNLRSQTEDNNRAYRQDYLKDKAFSIQKELGDNIDEIEMLRKKVEESGMTEEAYEKCMLEISRLASISSMSPESSVVRNYIDVLLDLPWKERSVVNTDLVGARKVLDADHRGLDKVKDRIVEYLAIQQVGSSKSRGSVMCLLGPPGVGKTSLGQSVARATGRKFVRLSLGGIHDEATIRGHRRTYVASMPGRILKAMADAKVKNPVFMLDEIEKLDASFSGDPMAALLEVIDPEQNHHFSDHFAEVDYDLSEVMFIATANSIDGMYGALRDRMEFIELPGYTDIEKAEIATRHLLPKLLKAAGLKEKSLSFNDAALKEIIRNYTKEAGVRSLERSLAKVIRKTVLEQDLATKKKAKPKKTSLSKAKVNKLLGVPIHFPMLKRSDRSGVVNGLAVVADWEGIVHQIDAVKIKSGKGVKKTGKIKPHIQQTIEAAVTVLRANQRKYGIAADLLDTHGVHIHYPNVDITHDGNSNGLAIFVLLVSVLNNIPVRMDTAMTGAINLRGEACAIGGLRAKLVGAWREKIKRVLIPHVQLREITDVPKEIVNDLEIIPVRNVHEALSNALVSMPKPLAKKSKKIIAKKDKASSTKSSSLSH